MDKVFYWDKNENSPMFNIILQENMLLDCFKLSNAQKTYNSSNFTIEI